MQKTFGRYFQIEITGFSHGEFVGGIIRNCPKGLSVDYDFIAEELQRRKPQRYGTPRKETDKVEFLSGITDGITDGTPIEFKIKNNNVKKQDYDDFRGLFRPAHADYPYYIKYGQDDLRYKDAASARMFLPTVVAGSLCKIFLKRHNISVNAKVISIGATDYVNNQKESLQLLDDVSLKGDTVGGKIRCKIKGVKAGLGEPIFEKISSNLAFAMMNIPSAVSFSIGDIENRPMLTGSEDSDNWNGDFTTKTNHSGGINAGITNGMPIIFTVGFHPIHTLRRKMTLISENGELTERHIGGRHDICQVLRTPVIAESLSAIVITDFLLLQSNEKTSKTDFNKF